MRKVPKTEDPPRLQATGQRMEHRLVLVGGDTAIGHVVQQLLAGAGFGVKLIPEPVPEDLAGALDGARLVFAAPALSAGSRRRLLATLGEKPATEGVQVLEMPWPYSSDEILRIIERALAADGGGAFGEEKTRSGHLGHTDDLSGSDTATAGGSVLPVLERRLAKRTTLTEGDIYRKG